MFKWFILILLLNLLTSLLVISYGQKYSQHFIQCSYRIDLTIIIHNLVCLLTPAFIHLFLKWDSPLSLGLQMVTCSVNFLAGVVSLAVMVLFAEYCSFQRSSFMMVSCWSAIVFQMIIALMALFFGMMAILESTDRTSQKNKIERLHRIKRRYKDDCISNRGTSEGIHSYEIIYGGSLLSETGLRGQGLDEVQLLYYRYYFCKIVDSASLKLMFRKSVPCSICKLELCFREEVILNEQSLHLSHWSCFEKRSKTMSYCPKCHANPNCISASLQDKPIVESLSYLLNEFPSIIESNTN